MGGNYPDDGWTEFNFNCGDNFMGDPHECYGTARTAVGGEEDSNEDIVRYSSGEHDAARGQDGLLRI